MTLDALLQSALAMDRNTPPTRTNHCCQQPMWCLIRIRHLFHRLNHVNMLEILALQSPPLYRRALPLPSQETPLGYTPLGALLNAPSGI